VSVAFRTPVNGLDGVRQLRVLACFCCHQARFLLLHTLIACVLASFLRTLTSTVGFQKWFTFALKMQCSCNDVLQNFVLVFFY